MQCKVVRTGKEVNLGEGDGMQVSCKMKTSDPRKMVDIFCKNIQCSTKEGKRKAVLSQQSDALNSLIPNVFANSNVF